MKKCFKCGMLKELNEFYKHPQMSDGHVNKCKECNKKDVRDNRQDKIDYYIEYDRQRDSLPHRVELKRRYGKTPQGKENLNKYRKKWLESNTIKRSAQIILGNAVKRGALIKPRECQECGNENKRIHGHHDDYNYPMVVRWLCPKCHTKWHRENGSGING